MVRSSTVVVEEHWIWCEMGVCVMKVKVGGECDYVLLVAEDKQIYTSLPLLVEFVVKRLECGRRLYHCKRL